MKKLIFIGLVTVLNADVTFKYPVPNGGTESGLRIYGTKVGSKYHTGLDIRPSTSGQHPQIINSNFGKKSKRLTNGSAHGFGNGIIIQYLLNNGLYKYGLYGHMQSAVENFDYYSQRQFLAKMSGTAYNHNGYSWNDWTQNRQDNPRDFGWLHHLHIEFNKEAGFNEFGYSSGKPDNYGYSNPSNYFNAKKILSIFLKRITSASESNFDIYGISNKTIYGHLNINATGLSKVGILVRDSKSRSDAEHSSASYNAQKFLAESSSNFNGLDGSSDKYIKGDYLFVPYVNQNGHRYGYPLKFSFVDEGSFIIDNDKTTYSNGASYSETLSHTVNSDKNNVPGYFLTSRLIKVTANNSNDFAKWSVPSATDGEYHIYAHIPKGATASDCTYTIRTTDGDKTKSINQSSMTKENWADLGTYSLNSDGYVKLSLRNDNNGEWMAFDAIKFEQISGGEVKASILDGVGSIIRPSKSCFGCDKDEADMQIHSSNPSTVVFQWLKTDTCKYLDIGILQCNNDEQNCYFSKYKHLDVTIHKKIWSDTEAESFKTKLPITIAPVTSQSSWNTIAITSQKPIPFKKKIVALCKKDKNYTPNKTPIDSKNVKFESGYTWAGNSSIIRRSNPISTRQDGIFQDTAIGLTDRKSVTLFQWQPSSNCLKLKLKSGEYPTGNGNYANVDSVDMKFWNKKIWNLRKKCNGKLPCTIDAPNGANGYYLIRVRAKSGAFDGDSISAVCTK